MYELFFVPVFRIFYLFTLLGARINFASVWAYTQKKCLQAKNNIGLDCLLIRKV